eukprot:Skav221007  [mRNA]  locus=scaffold2350:51235:63915:+ [translate_table: standard]
MAAMDATILPAPPEEPLQAALHWQEQLTQKEIRCRRLVAENQNPSARYVGNTPKEELLLEHVREFEDQFVNVYGNRFLFLCPPNEHACPQLDVDIEETKEEDKQDWRQRRMITGIRCA